MGRGAKKSGRRFMMDALIICYHLMDKDVLQIFPVIFDVKILSKNWHADQATIGKEKKLQLVPLTH